MSSRPTESSGHDEPTLLEHVEHIRLAAAEVPDLSPEERETVVGRVVGFLRANVEATARSDAERDEVVAMIEELAGTSRDDAQALQARLNALHARLVAELRDDG
ncbi:MAG TPA: hypothetical protein VFR97_07685 [Capillimicrobium sp.]|nr:hypothetical protein [Capillimicrobium sp.]